MSSRQQEWLFAALVMALALLLVTFYHLEKDLEYQGVLIKSPCPFVCFVPDPVESPTPVHDTCSEKDFCPMTK